MIWMGTYLVAGAVLLLLLARFEEAAPGVKPWWSDGAFLMVAALCVCLWPYVLFL